MNDPKIHSSTWDWDNVATARGWKHSTNVVHTRTRHLGKDKDVGYEIMRVSPKQRWHPAYLLQPAVNAVLMAFFEVGCGAPQIRLRGHPHWQARGAQGPAAAS